ncbi:DUF4345 domain-containing protein [Spongiivirga sp. MCCC 1A20706]|uniref:DUF4345 domain-containing protein n=1 Tax=Spongiivirga sp. MCCC 1A20706 TaxID=3160963 RepID=UPI0039774615
MKKLLDLKHLHLITSAVIVISVGLLYGAAPSKIMPWLFGFDVEDLELKNIFRAQMGLYLALGIYWIVGVRKTELWRGATISNIVFMGGLALGRLVSTIMDGFSIQYGIGMILEAVYAVWGIYNLTRYHSTS